MRVQQSSRTGGASGPVSTGDLVHECVALVEGTNIVRRDLGISEARVRAADPRLWFASGAE